MSNLERTEIFNEIVVERDRQDKKWGIQDHPMLDQTLIDFSVERMCEAYEVPTETRAKFLTDSRAQNGNLTYFHILQEEVSEAICAMKDKTAMREELIQVAAVVVSMIECLDRDKND